MSEKLRFERHYQKSAFHNPTAGNRLDTQELEIRRDPLTGQQSVFNPRLYDQAGAVFVPSDPALIEKPARQSEPFCFLCQDRWRQTSPMYPEDVLFGGRPQIGQAFPFPGRFPVSQVHAVIRVNDKQFRGAQKNERGGGFPRVHRSPVKQDPIPI